MIAVEILNLNQIERIEQVVAIAKSQLSSSVTLNLVRTALSSPSTIIFVALSDEEGNNSNKKVIGTATLGVIHCISGLRGHIEDVVVDEHGVIKVLGSYYYKRLFLLLQNSLKLELLT
ncbi:unnamed protein product [Cunninghamella blakesleeana]